jgi:hypothetical protein
VVNLAMDLTQKWPQIEDRFDAKGTLCSLYPPYTYRVDA